MSVPALDQFMAFNDELAALVEAGVPMETGIAGDLRIALQEINASVARQVSQGASLDASLGATSLASTPGLYRSLARTGLNTGDLQLALRASNRLADSRAQMVQTAAYSIVYPLLLLFLVYVGTVGFCLWLTPTLKQMYFSAGVTPRRSLTILGTLADTLPYWVAFPPLVLAAAAAISRRATTARFVKSTAGRGWLPGLRRAKRDNQAANFAHIVAALLESGVPFPEAVGVAQGAWGDTPPMAGTQASMTNANGSPGAIDQPIADFSFNHYPPLLRWALLDSEATLGRSAALRLAADTYRASAERRLERWRVAAPLALCVVVGGGATLIYGLALFVPIIDLLEGLARS